MCWGCIGHFMFLGLGVVPYQERKGRLAQKQQQDEKEVPVCLPNGMAVERIEAARVL